MALRQNRKFEFFSFFIREEEGGSGYLHLGSPLFRVPVLLSHLMHEPGVALAVSW